MNPTFPTDGPRDGPPAPAARVARLPYLNTAPFYVRWDSLERVSEGRWLSTVLPPRQLGLAAEAGQVDAGILAVADLFRLESLFAPLQFSRNGETITFGIANRDRVDSVLLFLRDTGPDGRSAIPNDTDRGVSSGTDHGRPGAAPNRTPDVSGPGRVLTEEEARRLHRARIGITGESSTSFRLLRLLAEVRWQVRPEEYRRLDLGSSLPPDLDGALVIGDLALRWRHRPPSGTYLAMDLAAGWQEWTGLPFVFACWAVRRSVPEEAKRWLGRFLLESLESVEGRYHELVRNLPEELGSREDLAAYLANFTYPLGPPELQAIALFRRLLDENGIVCSAA